MNIRTLMHLGVMLVALGIYFLLAGLIGMSPVYGVLAVIVYFAIIALFNYKTLMFYAANIAHAQGNTDKALRIFARLMGHKPKNPRAYINHAILLLRENRPIEALPLLETAKTMRMDILDEKNVYLSVASCYWLMGDAEKAVDVLEYMRTRFDYVNHYALATLGYMYFLKGDNDKALALTGEAIEDTPESAIAWDTKGQICLKLGNTDEAKEAFLKAVGFKPDMVDSHYYLGVIARGENDLKEAKNRFERALECTITAFNTVKRDEISQKLDETKSRLELVKATLDNGGDGDESEIDGQDVKKQ